MPTSLYLISFLMTPSHPVNILKCAKYSFFHLPFKYCFKSTNDNNDSLEEGWTSRKGLNRKTSYIAAPHWVSSLSSHSLPVLKLESSGVILDPGGGGGAPPPGPPPPAGGGGGGGGPRGHMIGGERRESGRGQITHWLRNLDTDDCESLEGFK